MSFKSLVLVVLNFASACQLYAGAPFMVDADGQPFGFDPQSPVLFTVDANPINAEVSAEAGRLLVLDAFAVWGAVEGSTLCVEEHPSSPRAFNRLEDVLAVQAAGGGVVIFDTTGAFTQLSGLDPSVPAFGFPNLHNGTHLTSFLALFNGPALQGYSPDRLRALMVRIFGQCLGLSYSAVNGPLYGQGDGPSAYQVEMMYPNDFGGLARTQLTPDDMAGLLRLYGTSPYGRAGQGAISGNVIMPDGVTPAGGIGIVARHREDSFGAAYGTVTDAHTGSFTLVGLRPGTYTVAVVDLGTGVDVSHGLPLRTDNTNPPHVLAIDAVFRAKVLGEFPAESEFYSGATESNDPVDDDPEVSSDIQVRADTLTGGIDIVLNRNPNEPYTRLLYPWVSNREGQFESILVVNNLAAQPATVTLTARRSATEQETVTRQIPPGGMLEEPASSLFTQLGSGSGYSVLLEADREQIRGRWVTNSLASASGASPSQGIAVRIPTELQPGDGRVGKRMLVGYLPRGSSQISAPVLVNLDAAPVDLTLNFYNQAGALVGSTLISDQPPFVPLAAGTDSLVSGEEDLYLIAETSGQYMTAVSFVFDTTFFETAIGNGVSVVTSSGDSTHLVYPWVSNNEGQFESLLIVNNFGLTEAQLELTARRADGATETVVRTVLPSGFLKESATLLFPNLGSGAGYTVTVSSSATELAGQWVTNNLQAASGGSPSIGVAVPRDIASVQSGNQVLLGYLPVTGSRTSAPVVVNLGRQNTDITLRFYDTSGNLILEETVANQPPLQPLPVLANGLLPQWSGNVYVVAESPDQLLTAVVFVFDNTFFEPAIGNATQVESPQASRLHVFQNVNLVPLSGDSESSDQTLLPNQTVVVRDGLIAAVGPSNEVAVPAGAVLIDGTGKFLMPGLGDAHTHILGPRDMLLLLANGVTTVFNMGDNRQNMPYLKRLLEEGRAVGPTIYAGQQIYGPTWPVNQPDLIVKSDEQVTRLVADLVSQGYDFLKPYEAQTAELLAAMNRAGQAHGKSLMGHLSSGLSLEEHFENGFVMVAHIEEFINDFFSPRINPSQIPDLVTRLRNAGAYVTTTLSVVEAITIYGQNPAGYNELLARPGVEYLDSWQRASWDFDFASSSINGEAFVNEVNFMIRVARDLKNGGVPLLLGTDTPLVGLVPGFAIHEEMRILQSSSWTPYEIYRAGSVNIGRFAAQHFGAKPFGSIQPGSRADLVLLEANPLEDVVNFQRRTGVMAAGIWYGEAQLQTMLEALRSDGKWDGQINMPVGQPLCHGH